MAKVSMAAQSTPGVISFHMKDVPLDNFPREGIQCEIPLLRPFHHRPIEDCEHEGVLKLKDDVASWLELHLVDAGDSREEMERVASTAVNACICLFPLYQFDNRRLSLMSHFSALTFVVDDWIEKSNMGSLDGGKQEQVINMLTNFIESAAENSDSSDKKVDFDMDLVGDDPMVGKLYGALSEMIETLNDELPDVSLERRREISPLVMRYAKNTQWGKVDDIGKYSELTARYFRHVDIGLPVYIEVLLLLENIDIPKDIKTHPMFVQLNWLTDHIFTVVNDVIGFKKDIIENTKDNSGMVIYKIMNKGLTPQQAIEEEIAFAKDCMHDYLRLKALILTRFKDCPDVDRYIVFVESFSFSNFQMYATSPRYLMVGSDAKFKEV